LPNHHAPAAPHEHFASGGKYSHNFIRI